MKTLYKLYLYSFPFVNAFALTETINWSIVLGLLLIVGAFFSPYHKIKLCSIDFCVALFFLSMFISNIINIPLFDAKQANHTMAWTVCFLLFFYVNRLYLRSLPIEIIYKILTRTFLILVCFCIAEFAVSTLFGGNLNEIIPRPQGSEYEAGFMGFVKRSRGFFSESGYAGMYIALTYPFVLYWQKNSSSGRVKKVVVFLLTMIALSTIFSTTFFIFFPIYYFLIFKFTSAKFYKRLLFVSPILIGLIAIFWQEIYFIIEISILAKFEMGSATIREANMAESVAFCQQMPPLHMLFGYGPGSYYKMGLSDAATSVYVNTWRDMGLFGLFSYSLIWVAALARLFFNRSSNLTRYLLLMVAMTLTYHISNMDYNFVSMWFVLAAIAEIDHFKLKPNNEHATEGLL